MAGVVLAPQPGKQELALNLDADVIFYGGAAGSSKSYTELLRFLRYREDPHFNAIYFRRTTTQLGGAGGLWQEAKDMYNLFDVRVREKEMIIQFPSGASAKFSHMEHEKNAIDHQGLQYSAIFWDELTHFSERQFSYLLSRLRSKAESNSFTMATMNPDPDSWVLKYVEWYLDDDGYPDKEKDGKKRYFIIVDGSPIFADTEEELIEKYPANCFVLNPLTKKKILVRPKSFIFLSGTIFDNPALIEKNPTYLAELQNLPEVERARLLHGNWYTRPKGSNYFERDWLVRVDKVPIGAKCVRAWDKASQEPSEQNRHPDYTAGSPLLYKCKDGFFYIKWSFEMDMKDKDTEIVGRFRKRPGERDQLILKQAIADGTDCVVIFAVDPGQSGKVEYQESSKKLLSEGYTVRPDPMPNNKSKLKRFEPFSSAVQNGLVRVVESSFPNKATLEAFYRELEAFNGDRSTSARKDDWADATASAFNYLNKQKILGKFSIPLTFGSTLKDKIMNN